MKSLAEVLWCNQTMFLSKQTLTIVPVEMLSSPKFLETTVICITSNATVANRPLCMGSGNYASITVVDLIQWKKLDSWNFYESDLIEARIEII